MALMTPTVQSNPTLNYINNTPTPNRNIPNSSQALVNYNLNKVGQIFNAVTQIQQQRMAVEAKAIATDEFNQLHSAFQNEVNNIFSEQGKNAIKARKGLEERLAKIYQDKSKEYQNYPPIIADAINQSYKELELRSIAKADSYVMQETVKYEREEKLKLLENKEQDVLNVYSNDALRKQGMEDLETHWDDFLLNDLGVEKNSEQYKAKVREVKTALHAKAISSMIDYEQWGQASNALNKAKDDMDFVTYNELKSKIWKGQQESAKAKGTRGQSLQGEDLANLDALYRYEFKKEESNHYYYVDEVYDRLDQIPKNLRGNKETIAFLSNGKVRFKRAIKKTDEELELDARSYANQRILALQTQREQYKNAKNYTLATARLTYEQKIRNGEKVTSYEDLFADRLSYEQAIQSGLITNNDLKLIIDQYNLGTTNFEAKKELENFFTFDKRKVAQRFASANALVEYMTSQGITNEDDRRSLFKMYEQVMAEHGYKPQDYITSTLEYFLNSYDIDHKQGSNGKTVYTSDDMDNLLGNLIENKVTSFYWDYLDTLKEGQIPSARDFNSFVTDTINYQRQEEIDNLVNTFKQMQEDIDDKIPADVQLDLIYQCIQQGVPLDSAKGEMILNNLQEIKAYKYATNFGYQETLPKAQYLYK